jgi:hypothetical protein
LDSTSASSSVLPETTLGPTTTTPVLANPPSFTQLRLLLQSRLSHPIDHLHALKSFSWFSAQCTTLSQVCSAHKQGLSSRLCVRLLALSDANLLGTEYSTASKRQGSYCSNQARLTWLWRRGVCASDWQALSCMRARFTQGDPELGLVRGLCIAYQHTLLRPNSSLIKYAPFPPSCEAPALFPRCISSCRPYSDRNQLDSEVFDHYRRRWDLRYC